MGREPSKPAPWREPRGRPVVGITVDLIPHNGIERHAAPTGYAHAVLRAGGTPVLLVPDESLVTEYLRHCEAFVFTGGDDPAMEPFGVPTHPAAVRVKEPRQRFETALLRALADAQPNRPVLGVCLGMQMMALVAGGGLNQHLPDTHEGHAGHWDHEHDLLPEPDARVLEPGRIWSRHRQAIEHAGTLAVLGRAPDGVIEAVGDPARAFYLGVQWHPERTAFEALGQRLFDRLVAAARAVR